MMGSAKRVLLAGETFTIAQSAGAGFTQFHSGSYANGAEQFLAVFAGSSVQIEQLPSERCERDFPRSIEALTAYDAVILSDISALTLLFTPESRTGSLSVNRLALLVDYVAAGGGLMMAGGYGSFQGMDGGARYHGTPLEECMPVQCLPHSDGLEAPEGLVPERIGMHPLTAGLPDQWPPILGLNKVVLRENADTTLLAKVNYRGKTYPLLAVRQFGEGRSLCWMTDIGPHWMSQEFMASDGYKFLMRSMVDWLCAGP
jgi:uncharacterized membrane protein